MIGAVIGDLAAWSYEHDQEGFYKELVSPDARLSGYGLLLLSMWGTINEGGLIHKNRFYVTIGKALSHADPRCVDLPLEWRRWGYSDYDKPISFNLKIALIISAFVDSGFLPEERQRQLDWVSFFHGGKQERYASFIMAIIRRLHEGKTKDEATVDTPESVINYYPSGTEHQWRDLLEYTTFAWRCFYYSKDFQSALINARKCPANRHLAMVLAGAFAEAKYGCECCLTKGELKIGTDSGAYTIEIPRNVKESYGMLISEIRR